MFQVLLEERSGGFLVHCSAGKDRTGFAAAMIKLALGVSREVVERDYLLTNDFVDYENEVGPRLAKLLGDKAPSKAAALALSGVRLEYLHAAFDSSEATFGTIDGYLHEALALDEPTRQELQHRYLEP